MTRHAWRRSTRSSRKASGTAWCRAPSCTATCCTCSSTARRSPRWVLLWRTTPATRASWPSTRRPPSPAPSPATCSAPACPLARQVGTAPGYLVLHFSCCPVADPPGDAPQDGVATNVICSARLLQTTSNCTDGAALVPWGINDPLKHGVTGAIFGLGAALALIVYRHRKANRQFSKVRRVTPRCQLTALW